MGDKPERIDPLKTLGQIASALDAPETTDNLTPAQVRAFREAADELRAAIEMAVGDLTPPLLVAFTVGAQAQVSFASHMPAGPLSVLQTMLGGEAPSENPDGGLLVMVALLARDLLAGGRVAWPS